MAIFHGGVVFKKITVDFSSAGRGGRSELNNDCNVVFSGFNTLLKAVYVLTSGLCSYLYSLPKFEMMFRK